MDVILVDERDEQIGTMEKLEVHQKALLHRAFSIFIFNSKGEMLLHRRADKKYHSAGLWSNACCSHPAPGDDIVSAAHRRLQEEMGISAPLQKAFTFTYKAVLENGLTEYEFDHVFTGIYDGDVFPNKEEVSDYCFKQMDELQESVSAYPQKYTAWFKIALPKLDEFLQKNKIR